MNVSRNARLNSSASQQDHCRPRQLRLELLEDRRLLSASRAAEAINQFAYDVYEHMQTETGNLFYSPLSIATALAMTYAGAGGQTAAEMEQVLHFGTEPGIHSSFRDLLSIFETQTSTIEGFELEVANAIWPALGLPVLSSFIDTVEDDYSGHVQNLNYSNPTQARSIINNWILNQTHGKIPNMVDQLTPDMAMVLTNAVYFKGLWDYPFDSSHNYNDSFHVGDGESISVRYMFTPMWSTRTRIEGFDVIELPFEGGASSMVLAMPLDENGSYELTPEIFSQIDAWLASEEEMDLTEIALPKFATSIKTDLKQLLIGMGMSTAFSPGVADFSGMTDGVWIEKIYHKATIELNEEGTEASAATVVELPLCFAAGTPILTPDGEKLIEELQAGDFVMARDELNLEGEVQPKMVERLLMGEAEVLELHAGGQVVRTTSLHPFFVRGRGWTPAGEIKVEDRLSTNHGDWIEVEKVLITNESEAVYNLRVADHHTYFVGSRAWKFGLWVHNYYETGFYADHPFHMMIRDNETSTITFMGRIDNPSLYNNNVNPTFAQIPATGDFDGDGDVDGRDFLAWQRGNGDSVDLAAWQGSYGQGSSPQLAAIADAALEDDEFLTGWLIDDVAEDDEAFAIQRVTPLEIVSDPVTTITLLAQASLVDASIASRGRYGEVAAEDTEWLDDELLEDIFSAD